MGYEEIMGGGSSPSKPKSKDYQSVMGGTSDTPIVPKTTDSQSLLADTVSRSVYSAEAGATLATGVAATIPAGFVSAVVLPFTDLDTAVDVQKKVQSMLTYSPKTKGGQEYTNTLIAPLEAWDNMLMSVSDSVYDITDSPVLATAVYTGLNFVDPIKPVAKGFSKAKSSVLNTVSIDKAKLERKLLEKWADESNVDKTTLANIKEGQELSKRIEAKTGKPLKLSAAASTLNPNIIRQQEALRRFAESRKDYATTAMMDDLSTSNLANIKDYWSSVFSITRDKDAASMLSGAALKKQSELDKLNNLEALYLERLQKIADSIKRDVPISQYGDELRKTQLSLMATKRAEGDAKYRAFGDFDVGYKPLENVLNEIESDPAFLPKTNPNIVPNIYHVVKDAIKRMQSATPPNQIIDPSTGKPFVQGDSVVLDDGIVGTFKQLVEFKKQAGQEFASNRALIKFDPNARKRNTFVKALLKSIDETLDNAAQARPDILAQYNDAKSFWKEEIVDVFENEAASTIAAQTRKGEYALNASGFLDNYFNLRKGAGGHVESIKAFKKIFSQSPESMKLMYDYILDDLSKTARGADGTLKPASIAKWLSEKGELVKELPELQTVVYDIQSLNENTLTAVADKRFSERKKNISKLIDRYNGEPKTVMRQIITNKKNMIQFIKDTKGDPTMRAQVIGDFVLTGMAGKYDPKVFSPDFRGINPSALSDVLSRHSDTLQLGMGKDHYQALKDISDALSRRAVEPEAKQQVQEPIGLAEKVARKGGKTVTSSINDIRNASKPQTSRTGLAIAGTGRVLQGLSESARIELEADILYNRDTAILIRDAIEYAKIGKEPPNFKDKVQKTLSNLGVPAYRKDVRKAVATASLIQQEEQN